MVVQRETESGSVSRPPAHDLCEKQVAGRS